MAERDDENGAPEVGGSEQAAPTRAHTGPTGPMALAYERASRQPGKRLSLEQRQERDAKTLEVLAFWERGYSFRRAIKIAGAEGIVSLANAWDASKRYNSKQKREEMLAEAQSEARAVAGEAAKQMHEMLISGELIEQDPEAVTRAYFAAARIGSRLMEVEKPKEPVAGAQRLLEILERGGTLTLQGPDPVHNATPVTNEEPSGAAKLLGSIPEHDPT